MDSDFDALVEQSTAAHNKTAEHALWKAALALPAWYFVSNDAGDDAEPVVGMINGRSHILAFTDEDRAADFSKRRAAQRGNEDTPVLEMDVPDAVEYFSSLREAGVDSALFNSGKYAFSESLVNIIDMFKRYRAK
jgi:hypothetical protein